MPPLGDNIARVVRVLSCTPLPPSDLVCVTVTMDPAPKHYEITNRTLAPSDPRDRARLRPTSSDALPLTSMFTLERKGAYRVDDRAILFAHPSRDFYLPDIPESLEIPDQKVCASFTHTCTITKRTTMGRLAPLSWVYNNQYYFFGFHGQEIFDVLKQPVGMASDTALVVCEYLGRHAFVVGEDITPLMRVQSIPHHRPPVFKPCDCSICGKTTS